MIEYVKDKIFEDIYFNVEYEVVEMTEEQIIVDAFLNYITQNNRPYSYGENTLSIFLFENFLDKSQITDFINSKLIYWLVDQRLTYDITADCFDISDRDQYRKILSITFYVRDKEIKKEVEVS